MKQDSELDRANSQDALPDLDVLYITRSLALQYGRVDWYCKPGWYRHRPSASSAAGWVTSGPFKTEAEALADSGGCQTLEVIKRGRPRREAEMVNILGLAPPLRVG